MTTIKELTIMIDAAELLTGKDSELNAKADINADMPSISSLTEGVQRLAIYGSEAHNAKKPESAPADVKKPEPAPADVKGKNNKKRNNRKKSDRNFPKYPLTDEDFKVEMYKAAFGTETYKPADTCKKYLKGCCPFGANCRFMHWKPPKCDNCGGTHYRHRCPDNWDTCNPCNKCPWPKYPTKCELVADKEA